MRLINLSTLIVKEFHLTKIAIKNDKIDSLGNISVL